MLGDEKREEEIYTDINNGGCHSAEAIFHNALIFIVEDNDKAAKMFPSVNEMGINLPTLPILTLLVLQALLCI